jgi:hypothetical protein
MDKKGRVNRERTHASLRFVIAGMEACWLYTALLLIQRKTGGDVLSPALILLFYPLSWLLHRTLIRPPRPWLQSALMGLAGWLTLSMLLGWSIFSETPSPLGRSFPAQFAAGMVSISTFPNQEQLFLVSGALLWWLGRRLAGLSQNFSTLISEFQFGIALLLLLFFMDSQWGLDLPGLILVCLAFFAFSFVGISLAHGGEGKGWLDSSHRRQWLTILFITICAAFALGLFLSATVKPDLLNLLLSVPKFIWHVAAEIIKMILNFLAGLFPQPNYVAMSPPPGPAAVPAEPPLWVQIFRLPDWVRQVGQVVVASLWLILILAALWSASSQILHWILHRRDHHEGASYEPLSGAFREDLLNLLRIILSPFLRLFIWLRRKGKEKPSLSPEAASVRRIYRQLLDRADSAGCPRQAAQTPGEYLSTLIQWRPEARRELSLITEAYVLARYGPSSPLKDRLEGMMEAWGRLRRLL